MSLTINLRRKGTRGRTSYEQRLWRTLEEIEAQVELPEELENLVRHVLWRDRAREGEP